MRRKTSEIYNTPVHKIRPFLTRKESFKHSAMDGKDYLSVNNVGANTITPPNLSIALHVQRDSPPV